MSSLECTVCLERYDLDLRQPKLLPCGGAHELCERCVRDLCTQEDDGCSCFLCPTCREPVDTKKINTNRGLLAALEERRCLTQQLELSYDAIMSRLPESAQDALTDALASCCTVEEREAIMRQQITKATRREADEASRLQRYGTEVKVVANVSYGMLEAAETRRGCAEVVEPSPHADDGVDEDDAEDDAASAAKTPKAEKNRRKREKSKAKKKERAEAALHEGTALSAKDPLTCQRPTSTEISRCADLSQLRTIDSELAREQAAQAGAIEATIESLRQCLKSPDECDEASAARLENGLRAITCICHLDVRRDELGVDQPACIADALAAAERAQRAIAGGLFDVCKGIAEAYRDHATVKHGIKEATATITQALRVFEEATKLRDDRIERARR